MALFVGQFGIIVGIVITRAPGDRMGTILIKQGSAFAARWALPGYRAVGARFGENNSVARRRGYALHKVW